MYPTNSNEEGMKRSMTFKIETLPKYRVAYMRQVGPYGPANSQVMENLKGWAKKKNLFKSAIIFGIPQDNPAITLSENCRYDACIVISMDYPLEDSVYEGELSGGEYATFQVKHTAEDIQKAWAEIFPALHNSGYQIDNKPILERYTDELVKSHYCEICVPVKPL